jgi:hypothetical protein
MLWSCGENTPCRCGRAAGLGVGFAGKPLSRHLSHSSRVTADILLVIYPEATSDGQFSGTLGARFVPSVLDFERLCVTFALHCIYDHVGSSGLNVTVTTL